MTVISLEVNLRAPVVLGDLQAAMRRGEVTRELWEIYASRKLISAGVMLDPRLSAPPFSIHPIHYIVQRATFPVQCYHALYRAQEAVVLCGGL